MELASRLLTTCPMVEGGGGSLVIEYPLAVLMFANLSPVVVTSFNEGKRGSNRGGA